MATGDPVPNYTLPQNYGDLSGTGGNTGSGWEQFVGPAASFMGNLLSGYSNSQSQKAQLQLQAQEFAQNMDMQRKAMEMQAGNQLNRLPMADKGQYLATNMAAPTAFQPRDFTQSGFGGMNKGPTGGAAAQLNANAVTANNYVPGAGGVNPAVLNDILNRSGAPASAQQSTQSFSYGGQQYTPQQWSDFLNKNPAIARQQNGG